MYLFLFIIGLAVGSFLNVVSLRYKEGKRLLDLGIINGRSHCMNCRKTLVWYELIPLCSFLWQKGKCRNCRHKISWQYPIVEFLSGIIFVLVPTRITNYQLPIFNFQSITQLPNYLITNYYLLFTIIIWLIIFSLLLLLSIIDFRLYIIPDSINILLGSLGIFLIIFQSFNLSIFQSFLGHYSLMFNLFSDSAICYFPNLSIFQFFNLPISCNLAISHLSAALLGAVFFGLIIILSKGCAMGWGDFKLAIALGLIFGWPDFLMALFLSFTIGAIVSLFLIIRKKKKIKDAVPLGPFLALGALTTFLFGYQIVDGYFKLFGL
ncbi:MAG: prepilin peptidase [Patescibacteria group bacterium]|nr:prepilin peptidase [Patescibacteria group bacterium]